MSNAEIISQCARQTATATRISGANRNAFRWRQQIQPTASAAGTQTSRPRLGLSSVPSNASAEGGPSRSWKYEGKGVPKRRSESAAKAASQNAAVAKKAQLARRSTMSR